MLDDLSTGREANLAGALARGAVLHVADVLDEDAVAALVAEHAPEAIFHLAAQIDVRRSVAEPAWDARVNLEGTLSVLEAARRHRIRRVVHSSTGGALYGDAAQIPTPEGAPLVPLSPYGLSKAAADGACALYERLHGLSTVALRYGNVYGPRQDPAGEAGVIAILCALARDGGAATVFGDGRQTRDYVYVGDVVAANLLAAGSDVRGPLNVGTGRETSVLALLDALRALSPGGEIPTRHAAGRLGEVARSCLDVARAERALGWRARTDLPEGLRLTLAASAP